MARTKVTVTRTFAPLQFEALEPHRFEDLVRQLIYDFRDWQSIESTGRTGSDGGFDVRAYERNSPPEQNEQSEGDDELLHPMEGRKWMIQAKREKSLGPTAVRKILEDVDEADPPYGYILAAAVNFSKESFDAFREVLRSKGVMEFYLWGRGELEDMLHLPKNDRILFTFFGLSLVSKRRTRTTEQRSVVVAKNKLFKVLGSRDGEFHTEILLRDIKDDHYPYKTKYADFKTRPRWLERTAFKHHPLGLLIHSRKYYAFVERHKKEWDFTTEVDLHWHSSLTDEERQAMHAGHERVKDVWRFLPRAQKAEWVIEGFVRYSDVLLIDPEGDNLHRIPHIFVDFGPQSGPYDGFWEFLEVGHTQFDPSEDGWTRIDFFPKKFRAAKTLPDAKKAKTISLDLAELKRASYGSTTITLFAADARYDKIRPRDLLKASTTERDQSYLRVTHVEKTSLSAYLENHEDSFGLQRTAAYQLGRESAADEMLTIIEAEAEYVFDQG